MPTTEIETTEVERATSETVETTEAVEVEQAIIEKETMEQEQNATVEEREAIIEEYTEANNSYIEKVVEKLPGSEILGGETSEILTDINKNVKLILETTERQNAVLNEKITEMQRTWDAKYDQLLDVQKATAETIRERVSEQFKNKTSVEAKLNETIKEIQEKLSEKESINETLIDLVREQMREHSAEMDNKNPEQAKKAKSIFGERTWKLMKAFMLLGTIASLVLVGFILSDEYTGCYQIITGGDEVLLKGCKKFYTSKNASKCGCGSSKRDVVSAGPDICTSGSPWPYCRCFGGAGGPTCSSDISREGAISYNYVNVGPFEALGKGMLNLGNNLFDDLGLGSLKKYIMYFVIFMAAIITIPILLRILKYFVE